MPSDYDKFSYSSPEQIYGKFKDHPPRSPWHPNSARGVTAILLGILVIFLWSAILAGLAS